MDFPIGELIDEDARHAKLARALHPAGFTRPRCKAAGEITVLRRHRAPVRDHRRWSGRRAFDAFTGSAPQGTRRRPSKLILILRGIARGVPTAQLARELDRDRERMPLGDEVLEAGEAYQDAGGKRRGPPRSGGPAASPGERAARPPDPRE